MAGSKRPYSGLELCHGLLVVAVDPAGAQLGSRAAADSLDAALQEGGVGVVAGLHLGEEQRQQIVAEVHLSPDR